MTEQEFDEMQKEGEFNEDASMDYMMDTIAKINAISYEDWMQRVTPLADYDKGKPYAMILHSVRHNERYNPEDIQQLLELTANDKSFELDAATLLWVAQRTRELYKSLKVEQKTRFLSLLLSNLQIKQKTVLPSLLAPFASLVSGSKSLNWLPGLDVDASQGALEPALLVRSSLARASHKNRP